MENENEKEQGAGVRRWRDRLKKTYRQTGGQTDGQADTDY